MATYPLSEAYIDGDVLTAANVNSITEGVNDIAFGVFNAQTGTTYTLALTDVAKVVSLTNAAAIPDRPHRRFGRFPCRHPNPAVSGWRRPGHRRRRWSHDP